jgi:hypothetical protein
MSSGMIEFEKSGVEILKTVICFTIIAGFSVNAFAINGFRDMAARKKLVEKYKDHNLISTYLEILLTKELNDKDTESVNKYFSAPRYIASDKSAKATEALIDLLDFRVGVHINFTLMKVIEDRGRETILFLKKKISQKPLTFERQVKERDKDIVELIKTICRKTKGDEIHFTTKEILRNHLYDVQMRLAIYYCERGHYPYNLVEVFSIDDFEIGADEKFHYKSYGQIYYLCALGEDGKFGTADDITPPYNTDLFSFPEHFTEHKPQ